MNLGSTIKIFFRKKGLSPNSQKIDIFEAPKIINFIFEPNQYIFLEFGEKETIKFDLKEKEDIIRIELKKNDFFF